MSNISFASICPHPPLLLPGVSSETDKNQVKKTIENLKYLGKQLKESNPDVIVISSPHTDWGFNVPLHFLAKNFKGDVITYLTGIDSPQSYIEKGKKFYQELSKDKKYALIASGDLSHCLKEDGPYGFHPEGPNFDKDLIRSLKKKDIENIINLDNLYPNAGECGLRSFCFILGIIEKTKISYQPKILSYEAPFGVGYLVANFKL